MAKANVESEAHPFVTLLAIFSPLRFVYSSAFTLKDFLWYMDEGLCEFECRVDSAERGGKDRVGATRLGDDETRRT